MLILKLEIKTAFDIIIMKCKYIVLLWKHVILFNRVSKIEPVEKKMYFCLTKPVPLKRECFLFGS